jgi:hypothetical protein
MVLIVCSFISLTSQSEDDSNLFSFFANLFVGITLALTHRRAIIDCVPENEKEMLGKRFDWLEKNREKLKFTSMAASNTNESK